MKSVVLLYSAILFIVDILNSLFHLYVVIIILTNHRLRNCAFYMLHVALQVTDMGSVWTNHIFNRVRETNFLDNFYLYYGPSSFLSIMCTNGFAFFNNAQKQLILVLAANRLTAVLCPLRQQHIWSKANCRGIIALIVGANFMHAAVSELVGHSFFENKTET
uniref:G protein-coupled receptor n=1 Tax=Steinernema glaseri TaxID=37863 RepID=A0A1I7YFM9_9BILA